MVNISSANWFHLSVPMYIMELQDLASWWTSEKQVPAELAFELWKVLQALEWPKGSRDRGERWQEWMGLGWEGRKEKEMERARMERLQQERDIQESIAEVEWESLSTSSSSLDPSHYPRSCRNSRLKPDQQARSNDGFSFFLFNTILVHFCRLSFLFRLPLGFKEVWAFFDRHQQHCILISNVKQVLQVDLRGTLILLHHQPRLSWFRFFLGRLTPSVASWLFFEDVAGHNCWNLCPFPLLLNFQRHFLDSLVRVSGVPFGVPFQDL